MYWLDQEWIGTVDQCQPEEINHHFDPEAGRPPGPGPTRAAPHQGPRAARCSRMDWLGPGLALIAASIMGPLYLTSLRPPTGRIVNFYQEWASAPITFRACPSTPITG